jgi:hypothetical protein
MGRKQDTIIMTEEGLLSISLGQQMVNILEHGRQAMAG